MPKTKHSKKKFIDKKKSVTFNLVHRSQRDPLIADETAPQRVLVPVNANIPPRKDKDPELLPEQRREEQQKYGIYFDDDYNYLQHLKDSREVTLLLTPKAVHKPKNRSKKDGESALKDDEEDEEIVIGDIRLPSSVFASEVEEDVGLLNRGAPQGLCLDLDPDVVAALDDDFDHEDPDNMLEDNFMELATGGDIQEVDEDYDDDEGSDSDDVSSTDDRSDQAFASDDEADDSFDSQDVRRRPQMPSWDSLGKEETRSRFSQYSMSSSVIRRNQGLSLLDDRFEKMYTEYDDTELGALDCEEIEGYMPDTNDMLLQAADEFEKSKQKYQLDKEKEMARLKHLEEEEQSTDAEDDLITMEVRPKEKWDCESILSTYSNLYNHPKMIQEPKKQKIKINIKTGMPMDVLGKDNKLTVKSLAKFNALNEIETKGVDEDGRTNAETILTTLSVLSIRPNNESQEEKRDRKRLLREYRKERRIEKKANKEVFKEEKKRQEKIMMNNRNNVQGNRIL